jgi:WD40 repeat protein
MFRKYIYAMPCLFGLISCKTEPNIAFLKSQGYSLQPYLGGGDAQLIRFSHSGKVMATCGHHDFNLWDLTKGCPVYSRQLNKYELVRDLIFSNGDTSIIYSDKSGIIRVLNIAENIERTVDFAFAEMDARGRLTVEQYPVENLCLSDDGTVLMASGGREMNNILIGVWDFSTLAQIKTTRFEGNKVRFSAKGDCAYVFHRNGSVKRIAFNARLDEDYLIKADNNSSELYPRFASNGPYYPAISPSGNILFANRYDGVSYFIDTSTGKIIDSVNNGANEEENSTAAAFTLDGSLCAIARNSGTRIWDLTKRQWHPFSPVGVYSPATSVSLTFSPDGKNLLESHGQSHSVWEVRSGKLLAEFSQPSGDMWFVLDSSGRFDGSERGRQNLYYTKLKRKERIRTKIFRRHFFDSEYEKIPPVYDRIPIAPDDPNRTDALLSIIFKGGKP